MFLLELLKTKDGSEVPIPVKVVGCFAAVGALSTCSWSTSDTLRFCVSDGLL